MGKNATKSHRKIHTKSKAASGWKTTRRRTRGWKTVYRKGRSLISHAVYRSRFGIVKLIGPTNLMLPVDKPNHNFPHVHVSALVDGNRTNRHRKKSYIILSSLLVLMVFSAILISGFRLQLLKKRQRARNEASALSKALGIIVVLLSDNQANPI
ncbi:uncharacterized protein F4822DRAFT_60461 [Hypoxylon trugodes]|uniref:uncharacterized protein n=1 Tax=Hypoxylon trugodes TaxID=326681 RepID=UPI002192D597|nr:uncharacterized protein F4822DRAFT_60461 [Hypoxylon trugodes]KAI1384086.1 hypothetical protein F4822DRAFT_60461 [Hypoxylon trugodes]